MKIPSQLPQMHCFLTSTYKEQLENSSSLYYLTDGLTGKILANLTCNILTHLYKNVCVLSVMGVVEIRVSSLSNKAKNFYFGLFTHDSKC